MTDVSGFLQGIMDPSHELGSIDVNRVLVLKAALLDTDNKSEFLDVLWQFLQGERNLNGFLQIEEFKCLEIADQNVSGELAIF
nr:hypothetical protein [uncultured Roseibium sp.]